MRFVMDAMRPALVACLLACGCTARPQAAPGTDPNGPSHEHMHSRDAAGHEHCVCDEVRLSNGWCAACQAGYVAGVRIESADLFDVIDAHRHQFIAESIECQGCQRALSRTPLHGSHGDTTTGLKPGCLRSRTWKASGRGNSFQGMKIRRSSHDSAHCVVMVAATRWVSSP